MKAAIYSNSLLIGHTDLRLTDVSMGCVFGEFIPNENYFDKIQKNVWQFWADNKTGHKHIGPLRFNAQLENGCFLNSLGGYCIHDIPELPGEPFQIEIAGLFRDVITDYFQSNIILPFVEEPWGTISAAQKILFEDELKREINTEHVLAKYQCYALCKSSTNDDILFNIHHPEYSFALVHLTFSGATEKDPRWPVTSLFETFADFKEKKMHPDKLAWES